MKKRSLPCLLVILFAGVLLAGCQAAPVRQSLEAAGNPAPATCYQIEFLGVTESSEVASIWRYRMQEQACAQPLSGWMLELPACASVVDASPGSWQTVSPDGNSEMNGIKWQTGSNFQDGEFSVTLTGDLTKGMARVRVEGQNVSTGSLDGPVCKDRAAAASPSVDNPIAKVKVQSAYCRAKPLGKAEKIALLYRNQEAEIVGRNEDPHNPWWYVKIPDQGGNCWLWGMTSTTSGNVDGVPVVK
jgi:hypothetical protein